MTDPARHLMHNPFSLEEFKTTDVGIAASRAIEEHAADIRRAADMGAPPVSVLIRDLNDVICEGLHWRNVERMIADSLTPDYEKAGCKPVPIAHHPRGQCYTLISRAFTGD